MLRPLLPLALLCWLLSAQLAAGTRDTVMTSRALLARPAVTPLATPVNLTRQQFVQATWALQDVDLRWRVYHRKGQELQQHTGEGS
jgi:hypothetical protein